MDHDDKPSSAGIRVDAGSGNIKFSDIQISGYAVGVQDAGSGSEWDNVDIDAEVGLEVSGSNNSYNNFRITNSQRNAIRAADREKFHAAVKNNGFDTELQMQIFDDLKLGKPKASMIERVKSHSLYKGAEAVSVISGVIALIVMMFGPA